MRDIEQAIKDYIVKDLMYDKQDMVLDSDLSLIEDGIIDSLGIFLLISFIEEEFKVKIQPEEVVLENFETVNAIKSLVMSRLQSQASK